MRLRSTTEKKRRFIGCLIGHCQPEAESQGNGGPFDTEFFMVQGSGFKCMAWHDAKGQWRTAFENQILPNNVRVVE